jgi:hypothetical protein
MKFTSTRVPVAGAKQGRQDLSIDVPTLTAKNCQAVHAINQSTVYKMSMFKERSLAQHK